MAYFGLEKPLKSRNIPILVPSCLVFCLSSHSFLMGFVGIIFVTINVILMISVYFLVIWAQFWPIFSPKEFQNALKFAYYLVSMTAIDILSHSNSVRFVGIIFVTVSGNLMILVYFSVFWGSFWRISGLKSYKYPKTCLLSFPYVFFGYI